MSKLAEYYADRIRQVLRSGEANGITKAELMKRMSIKDEQLMDAVLEEAEKVTTVRCSNGKYFLQDEMPMEVRDYLKQNFTIGKDIEIRIKK